jgi:hypothetical protein
MSNLLLSPFTKSLRPLTVEEVAAIINRQPATVRKYARIGIIPGAFQTRGRRGHWSFKRKAFEAWWAKQGENPL